MEDINNSMIPIVKPSDLIAYESFKEAYDINIKFIEEGDKSKLIQRIDLYKRELKLGVTEAAINIFKI